MRTDKKLALRQALQSVRDGAKESKGVWVEYEEITYCRSTDGIYRLATNSDGRINANRRIIKL